MSNESVTDEFISRLRSFVRRRVTSEADADDITQNVLLKFVRARESIEAGFGPAWMFTVARREIVDRHRQAKLATTEIDPDTTASTESPDEATLAELRHCVQPLMRLLDPKDQAILSRFDLQGESQATFSDTLGIPRSTVKAQVQRARQRFHRQLLACCAIEFDARGMPTGIQPRRSADCECGESSPPTHKSDSPSDNANAH